MSCSCWIASTKPNFTMSGFHLVQCYFASLITCKWLTFARKKLSLPLLFFSVPDASLPKFNIDFVVNLLRQENAKDICVIHVPPEIKYCHYFIVVSGSSTRHLHAMAQYMLKMVRCFPLQSLGW